MGEPPTSIGTKVVMLTSQEAEQEATVVKQSAYGEYKISQNENNDGESYCADNHQPIIGIIASNPQASHESNRSVRDTT